MALAGSPWGGCRRRFKLGSGRCHQSPDAGAGGASFHEPRAPEEHHMIGSRGARRAGGGRPHDCPGPDSQKRGRAAAGSPTPTGGPDPRLRLGVTGPRAASATATASAALTAGRALRAAQPSSLRTWRGSRQTRPAAHLCWHKPTPLGTEPEFTLPRSSPSDSQAVSVSLTPATARRRSTHQLLMKPRGAATCFLQT